MARIASKRGKHTATLLLVHDNDLTYLLALAELRMLLVISTMNMLPLALCQDQSELCQWDLSPLRSSPSHTRRLLIFMLAQDNSKIGYNESPTILSSFTSTQSISIRGGVQ